jgi:hypothetical protein
LYYTCHLHIPSGLSYIKLSYNHSPAKQTRTVKQRILTYMYSRRNVRSTCYDSNAEFTFMWIYLIRCSLAFVQHILGTLSPLIMRVVVSAQATVLHVAGLLWATPSFERHLLLYCLCDVGVNSPILQQNRNYSLVRTRGAILAVLAGSLSQDSFSHRSGQLFVIVS